MSSVASEFGVFEMPFLIQDREQIKRFRPKVMEDFLIPAAASKGYLLLGMWESGFRQIKASTGPVKTPAGLKNLRLRVPEGDWHAKFSLTKHVYTPAFLIVSKSVFERLPPAVRAVFTETAAEMQDWCRSRSRS